MLHSPFWFLVAGSSRSDFDGDKAGEWRLGIGTDIWTVMMAVFNDRVRHDGEKSEKNGTEEPDINQLEVWGLGKAVANLGEEGGKHEQGGERHHNSVLKVEPLEGESGKGDDVDECCRYENGNHLWERIERIK